MTQNEAWNTGHLRYHKFFYREEDGHHYFFSFAHDGWICFPTFEYGEPDFMNLTFLSDVDLSEEDLKKLKDWLKIKSEQPF